MLEKEKEKRMQTQNTSIGQRYSRAVGGIGLLACALLMTTGCGIRRFRDPETGHVIYESHRFGNHEKFESITATYITRSGATNTICIRGYISDQVSGIKAAFEGAGTLSGNAAAAMVKP